MNRPLWSTPSAHPGEVGLSHCAKILSTLGLGANCCARAAGARRSAVAKQNERLGRMARSSLGNVWIADDFHRRQWETGRGAIRQSGCIHTVREDRSGFPFEGNVPRSSAEAKVIVQ